MKIDIPSLNLIICFVLTSNIFEVHSLQSAVQKRSQDGANSRSINDSLTPWSREKTRERCTRSPFDIRLVKRKNQPLSNERAFESNRNSRRNDETNNSRRRGVSTANQNRRELDDVSRTGHFTERQGPPYRTRDTFRRRERNFGRNTVSDFSKERSSRVQERFSENERSANRDSSVHLERSPSSLDIERRQQRYRGIQQHRDAEVTSRREESNYNRNDRNRVQDQLILDERIRRGLKRSNIRERHLDGRLRSSGDDLEANLPEQRDSRKESRQQRNSEEIRLSRGKNVQILRSNDNERSYRIRTDNARARALNDKFSRSSDYERRSRMKVNGRQLFLERRERDLGRHRDISGELETERTAEIRKSQANNALRRDGRLSDLQLRRKEIRLENREVTNRFERRQFNREHELDRMDHRRNSPSRTTREGLERKNRRLDARERSPSSANRESKEMSQTRSLSLQRREDRQRRNVDLQSRDDRQEREIRDRTDDRRRESFSNDQHESRSTSRSLSQFHNDRTLRRTNARNSEKVRDGSEDRSLLRERDSLQKERQSFYDTSRSRRYSEERLPMHRSHTRSQERSEDELENSRHLGHDRNSGFDSRGRSSLSRIEREHHRPYITSPLSVVSERRENGMRRSDSTPRREVQRREERFTNDRSRLNTARSVAEYRREDSLTRLSRNDNNREERSNTVERISRMQRQETSQYVSLKGRRENILDRVFGTRFELRLESSRNDLRRSDLREVRSDSISKDSQLRNQRQDERLRSTDRQLRSSHRANRVSFENKKEPALVSRSSFEIKDFTEQSDGIRYNRLDDRLLSPKYAADVISERSHQSLRIERISEKPRDDVNSDRRYANSLSTRSSMLRNVLGLRTNVAKRFSFISNTRNPESVYFQINKSEPGNVKNMALVLISFGNYAFEKTTEMFGDILTTLNFDGRMNREPLNLQKSYPTFLSGNFQSQEDFAEPHQKSSWKSSISSPLTVGIVGVALSLLLQPRNKLVEC